jgi:hypothetical protein
MPTTVSAILLNTLALFCMILIAFPTAEVLAQFGRDRLHEWWWRRRAAQEKPGEKKTFHVPSPNGISISVWCDEATPVEAIREFAQAIAGLRKLQVLELPVEEQTDGDG